MIVIGAGSGGLSVAAGAAQLGRRVALIEGHKMGGDCLNYGCVPSKALLAAARRAQVFRSSAAFGIAAAEPEVDFAAVKRHVREVIAAIEPNDSEERFRRLGCDVIRARARFTGPATVEADGRSLTAKHIVIATGSAPAVPPIPGLDAAPYLTNETIFDLEERPDHLLVIGGGPIGVEMAQAHRRLGCRVTLVTMDRILAKDDPELVEVVRRALVAEGVTLVEDARIERVDGTAITCTAASATHRIEGSHLLVATGRASAVADLGLDAAKVAHDRRGIRVDRRLRSSNPRVFAIGDCRVIADGDRLDSPQFTHAAGYEAGIVIQNALFRVPAKVDYRALPWVTYTDPELAHVGLTAAAAGPDAQVLRWPFHENDRAQAERHTEGLAQLVVRGGKVVGASIAGPHAGDMIHGWGIAIAAEVPLRKLAGTIVAYPTFAEAAKRAAGSAYTAQLFAPRTRRLVGLLSKLP